MSARNRAYESALETTAVGRYAYLSSADFGPNGTTDSDLLMSRLAGCEDGALSFTSLLKDVGIRG